MAGALHTASTRVSATGAASPLGASVLPGGVNFSVFSKHATLIELQLFDDEAAATPSRTIPLHADAHRTYHYWHTFVPGLQPGQVYGYRAHGPFAPSRGLRFDPERVLVDPYGLAVASSRLRPRRRVPAQRSRRRRDEEWVADPTRYDWEGDRPLKRPFAETVIYELHVRGFTRHPSSGLPPEKRGTYAGVIENIPYLKDLGITAVELLPVFQFDAQDAPPGRANYWGYQPVSFFAPHAAYSSRKGPLEVLDEFRDMVKALHRAGLEVILDVGFNHTTEAGADGPTLCYRGLANDFYYILEKDQSRYADYTGCGHRTSRRTMKRHPLAGSPAPRELLVDVDRLREKYYSLTPDFADTAQRVRFGTSGHRGSALRGSFNEAHVLAITQAICAYRTGHGISGPLYIGKDTHALSEPAYRTALEVLAANRVECVIDLSEGYTPTPVISHAILTHNRGRTSPLADGIVITPSHNPPEDGGFKYNPPTGGPADTTITRWIEDRANGLLSRGLDRVPRIPYERARRAATTRRHDYVGSYVADLGTVVDMDVIHGARLKIGVDPLGGASVAFWGPIAERYGIDVNVVNDEVDPTFRFVSLDWDGRIRMDCSSPDAMAPLIGLKDRFDVAFGNDPDADRHGIVTRGAGLMNPNHYLAASVLYLFTHRPGWRGDAGVGKTVVSSSVIDRVAATVGRALVEVPVGFKWFVPGLLDGSLGFGGEESAGASFLRRDGTPWVTDKDGIIMDLLAVELMARTRLDPAQLYSDLTRELGDPIYERIDAPATPHEKEVLLNLSAADISASELAGDPIQTLLTHTPFNSAAIGGLKVITAHGWFAARPSGTEDVYKLYAESFRGTNHLRRIQDEAQAIIAKTLTRVMR